MRNQRWILPIVLFALSLAAPAQKPPEPEFIVSSSWLEARLGDPSVVVLHVGTPEDYSQGHIPGSRLVRLEELAVTGPTGLRSELPPVNALVKAFGAAGVNGAARVVVYTASPAIQSATRVWFTLDYLGLGDRSSLLDGNLALWKKEGRPLSTQATPPATATFTPRPAPNRLVSAEWIRARLQSASVVVIDARAPQFFSGAEKGIATRAGRIPGAINLPFASFVRDDGRWKSPEELSQLLQAAAGTSERVRVTYCHLGFQATVPYFAARLLGLDVRLFDGSFQDWSQRPEFPVEASSQAVK